VPGRTTTAIWSTASRATTSRRSPTPTRHSGCSSGRAGHEVGTAVARTDVGWYHGRLGDHDSALTFCTRALTEHERLGNRSYLAHTWSCLADTYAGRGDRAEAIRCSEQALPLFRELGDRYGEASTLVRLGDLHDDAGIANTARAQAATILADFDTSAADQARSTDIKSP
jgi:tetratricopeptide (TPR) repeat protein